MNGQRVAELSGHLARAIDVFHKQHPELTILECVKALEDMSTELIDALLRLGGSADPKSDRPYPRR